MQEKLLNIRLLYCSHEKSPLAETFLENLSILVFKADIETLSCDLVFYRFYDYIIPLDICQLGSSGSYYVRFGIFLKQYKNDEACLEHIKEIKYPEGIFCEKCQKVTNFTKIKDRPVYQCSCGYQISPLAGTIFEKTTTPLQYWFYTMFIMSVTRSGVSAKQLQRELGVTYKTAWRIFKQIRILMANANSNGGKLDGIVEVDETFIGGRGKNRAYEWRANKPG